ncbi:MAG: HEAT repeat domain-containing protein [Thermodesulfobacteriota bacterium]|nr:HEAT repeat domain-containing protein [Thermodesulfobacteriota bacterium]
MPEKAPSGRTLKKIVTGLLRDSDMTAAMSQMAQYPPRRVINPLIGLLFNKDDPVQQRAVTAIGATTARLAESDMESARIIMRRLMWSLNDESGGIGWGAPEAMGEIMARHSRMALEYHRILFSYIAPDKNFLEHDDLRQDALNGIKRLAGARPELVSPEVELLESFRTSSIESERKTAEDILALLR